jgi:hypothetical protein
MDFVLDGTVECYISSVSLLVGGDGRVIIALQAKNALPAT